MSYTLFVALLAGLFFLKWGPLLLKIAIFGATKDDVRMAQARWLSVGIWAVVLIYWLTR